jgi:prefoldin subunit 5
LSQKEIFFLLKGIYEKIDNLFNNLQHAHEKIDNISKRVCSIENKLQKITESNQAFKAQEVQQ